MNAEGLFSHFSTLDIVTIDEIAVIDVPSGGFGAKADDRSLCNLCLRSQQWVSEPEAVDEPADKPTANKP